MKVLKKTRRLIEAWNLLTSYAALSAKFIPFYIFVGWVTASGVAFFFSSYYDSLYKNFVTTGSAFGTLINTISR